MVELPLTYEQAGIVGKKMLTTNLPPTAILCDDDVLAVGVYKAAAELFHKKIGIVFKKVYLFYIKSQEIGIVFEKVYLFYIKNPKNRYSF